jgi:hypothetical protein
MPPKLYEQLEKVYAAMREEANPETMVYRGYTTYLFEGLGYGISHYTPVMRRLKSMGCIQQLVVGGRGVSSEWKLIKEPTPELFSRYSGRRRSRLSDLEVTSADLEARIEKMEASIEDLASKKAV